MARVSSLRMQSSDPHKPPTLDYVSPPHRPPCRWTGGRRIGLAFTLAGVHFTVGLLAVSVFNHTPLINAVVITSLFPVGLLAYKINPHRVDLAFLGNAIFVGFAAAYVLSFWLNRRRRSD